LGKLGTALKKLKNAPEGVKASVAYTISNVIQNGIAFLTVPIFDRMMSTTEYGRSTVYTSWEGILTIFISLYLAYGSFNTAMIKFEKRREEYISIVDTICISLALLFVAIYFPFRHLFNRLFKLPTLLVLLMVTNIVAKNSLQCWGGKQRFEYKYKKLVAVTLAIAILSPLLSFILIRSTETGKGTALVIGTVTFSILVGTFFTIYNAVVGKKFFDKELWKYALSFNIPLIPYYLSQTIFNQSDRIMIDHICGSDKAAIYYVAYAIGMVLTFVLNAINNSYVPWMYGKIKSGERKDNQKMACYIEILMAVLLLLVVMFAPEGMMILGGKRYMSAVWVVPPVAISLLLLFISQMFINVEFYYEEKKLLVFGTVLAAVLNLALNALLIPIFGFVAAAYTTLASYLCFAGMNYLTYKKTLEKHEVPNDLYNMKYVLLILGVFTALTFMIMPLYNFMIIRYIVIAVALVIALLNINRIKRIIDHVRGKSNESSEAGS